MFSRLRYRSKLLALPLFAVLGFAGVLVLVNAFGHRDDRLIEDVKASADPRAIAAALDAVQHSQAMTTRWVSAALLLCITLLTIASFYVLRNATAPLRHVARVARSLAGGGLDVNINVTTEDEAGEVLAAMKQMAERLRTTADANTHSMQVWAELLTLAAYYDDLAEQAD